MARILSATLNAVLITTPEYCFIGIIFTDDLLEPGRNMMWIFVGAIVFIGIVISSVFLF